MSFPRDEKKQSAENTEISLPQVLSLLKKAMPHLILNANVDSQNGAEQLANIIITWQVGEKPEEYAKRVVQFHNLLTRFASALDHGDIAAANETRQQLHDHIQNPVYYNAPPFYNIFFDREKHEANKKLLNEISSHLLAPLSWNADRVKFLSTAIQQAMTADNLAIITNAGVVTIDPEASDIQIRCISGSRETGGNNKIYLVTSGDSKHQSIINSSEIQLRGLNALNMLKNEKCPYLIQTYAEIQLPHPDITVSDTKVVIRIMEKVTDLKKVAKDMAERTDIDKEYQIAHHAMNMIECILWMRERNIFFPDMKLSNMFVDGNNRLVLPDIKTLAPYSTLEIDANGNKIIKREQYESTREYEPPEVRATVLKKYNVNSYESYCIGLNIYILATGHHPAEDISFDALRAGERLPFKFDHPIFSSPSGVILQGIIRSLVVSDPREQLEDVRKLLKNYRERIGIKAQTSVPVSSTTAMIKTIPAGQSRPQVEHGTQQTSDQTSVKKDDSRPAPTDVNAKQAVPASTEAPESRTNMRKP